LGVIPSNARDLGGGIINRMMVIDRAPEARKRVAGGGAIATPPDRIHDIFA